MGDGRCSKSPMQYNFNRAGNRVHTHTHTYRGERESGREGGERDIFSSLICNVWFLRLLHFCSLSLVFLHLHNRLRSRGLPAEIQLLTHKTSGKHTGSYCSVWATVSQLTNDTELVLHRHRSWHQKCLCLCVCVCVCACASERACLCLLHVVKWDNNMKSNILCCVSACSLHVCLCVYVRGEEEGL